MYSLSIDKLNSFHRSLHMFKLQSIYKGIKRLNWPYWINTHFSVVDPPLN